jgi:hypothetical protein
MERRINKKIETYVSDFKNQIREKAISLNFQGDEKEKINELLEFIFEYERLVLEKDDVTKRKRIKNAIPTLNRCNAKRASGEQCTRRRKEGCEFCGTHAKGTPNGLIHLDDNENMNLKKMEVFAQEIRGILYYIDPFQNVYNTEDIMMNKENPAIIAKYENVNGVYTIKLLDL